MQNAAVIWVQFEVIGFHYWPDAPRHLAYLAQPHRHRFEIEASTAAEHDENDIDCHDMRDEAVKQFRSLSVGKGNDFGTQTCATLARRLATRMAGHYGRTFSVTVSEEGECGASVTADPE